jgi:hypothetical protein
MDMFLRVALLLIFAPIIGLMALGMIRLTGYLNEWLDDKSEDLEIYFGKYGFVIGLYLTGTAVYLLGFYFYYG